MRHEGADDRDALALREARRRVVQRLVEPVAALSADLGQTVEIGHRRPRIDHRGQSGCVGRDHPVFAETAFQPEARNAEIGILIGQLQIARVVGGFGYAPGQPKLRGVGDLTAHDQTVCLLEQASGRRSHDERGHQIFEHGSRPRDQRGAVRNGRRGAAEPEPMLCRNVPFGDREEAGEPRLGSQEIVTVVIERAFVDEISDRQQLPVVVEEKPELHRKRHRPRRAFEGRKPLLLALRGVCGLREIVAVRFDRTQDRSRPEQHIRAAAVATFDSERAGDVDHDLDIGAKAGELRLTIDLRKRSLLQSRCDRGERVVELMQGHGLSLAAVVQPGAFGARDVECVGDAAEALRGVEGTVAPLPARVGERNRDALPDCRCRRWIRISAPAVEDRACRTSCRNDRARVCRRPIVASVASSRSIA